MLAININETVGLLSEFEPEALEKIQREYPGYDQLLTPGVVLGDKIGDEKYQIDEKEMMVRGQVCKAGLELILNKAEEVIPKFKKRLTNLNRVQFISQIIIAISGASILSMLGQNEHIIFNYIAAGFATVGSLLTIFVQNKSVSINPNSKSYFQLYDILIDMKIEAEKNLNELTILLKLNNSSSREKMREIIEKGNNLSYDIRKILAKV